jgi:GTP:adenosylcobinamide-phosphate guanylyltransferase
VQLVILAAGHGRRFGGLKQLAPVGPNGEAIMDYTARAAQSCRYDGIVVIVRDDVREEIRAHIDAFWPESMPVELACQAPPPGTAQAVLAARECIEGPFAVANADDLYGQDALGAIRKHFAGTQPSENPTSNSAPDPHEDRHVLVGYQLSRTVLTTEPVTRGLCELGSSGELKRIVERTVQLRANGAFEARPLTGPESDGVSTSPLQLSGDACVSMNLWGFHPRVFDDLHAEIASFDQTTVGARELILPDVICRVVSSGRDVVHVVKTSARCIGITHREDIAIVREELATDASDLAPLRAFNRN